MGDDVFNEFGETISDCRVPYQGGSNSSNGLLTCSQHGNQNTFRKTTGSIESKRTSFHAKKKATDITSVQTSNHGGLKGLNPHVSGAVMPASFKAVPVANGSTILASQGMQMPNKCSKQPEINVNNDKRCAEASNIEFGADEDESEIGNFSLDIISSADAGLSFLENENDRENDFLHCDWNDIGNFDDIDQMFRNCDPTFGQQNMTDTSSCFPYSSNDNYGSVVINNATAPSSSSDLSAFDSTHVQNTATISYYPEDCLLDIDEKQPCPMYPSFEFVSDDDQAYARAMGPGPNSDLTDVSYQSSVEGHKKFGKTSLQVKQVGAQNTFAENRKDQFSGPYPYQIMGTQGHLAAKSSNYMPTFIPHSEMEGQTPSYQDHLMQIASGVRTQSNSCNYETSACFSSPMSQNIQHINLKEMSENQNVHRLNLTTSFQKQNNTYELESTSITNNICMENAPPTYLDSCMTQESLSTPNDQDDENIEKAISLKQLQNVMDQLDAGTKLCIRNSLYRLARSAEQRNNCATTSNGSSKRKTGVLSKGKPRQIEYMDTEADTNPIDRSIAQLLFYRPPENAAKSADEAKMLEPPITSHQIHGQLRRRQ